MSHDADVELLTSRGFDAVLESQFAEVACPSLPSSAVSTPFPTAMSATSRASSWGLGSVCVVSDGGARTPGGARCHAEIPGQAERGDGKDRPDPRIERHGVVLPLDRP